MMMHVCINFFILYLNFVIMTNLQDVLSHSTQTHIYNLYIHTNKINLIFNRQANLQCYGTHVLRTTWDSGGR
ncbi:hypothetical protein CIPAW_10G039700 [Carya illinoinensis]|uniref:Secreted protein n=1 Tax=Carya illinoinensis TaxID=32201 RepID=A0A8T1PBV5_CARIL|nr:hypothetical protein CIPAW_10G039700 [Carya illinoinensis]